jgi:hypothetical protein
VQLCTLDLDTVVVLTTGTLFGRAPDLILYLDSSEFVTELRLVPVKHSSVRPIERTKQR